jgi:organic radical activating enzyme
MKVNEIFYSVQGEGVHAGEAAIFIRFAGCNLNCQWCDTNKDVKMELTPQEVAAKIDMYPKDAMIILTGGEPLIQNHKELLHLLDCLCVRDKYIAIETNGTIYEPDIFEEIDWVAVSPKPNDYVINIPWEDICELKYIMSPDMNLGVIPSEKMFFRAINLQPMSLDSASTIRAVDWVLKFPHRFRLSVQLHKYINIR